MTTIKEQIKELENYWYPRIEALYQAFGFVVDNFKPGVAGYHVNMPALRESLNKTMLDKLYEYVKHTNSLNDNELRKWYKARLKCKANFYKKLNKLPHKDVEKFERIRHICGNKAFGSISFCDDNWIKKMTKKGFFEVADDGLYNIHGDCV